MQILLIVFATVLVGCDDGNWNPDAIKASKAEGDKIVSAINAYYAKEHRYPSSLDKLVPSYLPSVESPIAGKGRWEYQAPEDGSFYNLGFESKDTHPKAYGWSPGRKDWSYDSGDL